MRFLLTLLLLFWMAPLHAYTVRSGHPRLWLTPDTLTRLKAEVAANSEHWQRLQDAADRAVGGDVTAPNYALAYQLTGNAAYADKAIASMQQMVQRGLNAIAGGDGYDVREVMPDMAIGYDWCYDRLTATQRQQFRTQMEQWADWVWPETNPARAGKWAVDNPKNNYFNQFMLGNWLTGLALHGDSSKAQSYIDRVLGKWNMMVKPWLTTGAAGGYLSEGTHYGNDSLACILQYLSAHQTATDEALLNGMASWVREAFLCQLYLTTPTRDRIYPGGDQAMESSGALNDYRRFVGYAATSYLDDTTAGYARSWLDAITPRQNQWRHTRWEEMLWHRVDRPAVDYRTLPTFYYAAGAGVVSTRSGWGADATMLVAQCGPIDESHQDRGANSFMLFRGDWLAAHARLNSQSGLLGESENNNVLLIGGQGQDWDTGAPKVLAVQDSPIYTYFSGEAASAYDGQPLRQWQRDIVFLKASGAVVMLDTVDAVSASATKRLLFQSLNDLTLTTGGFQTTADGSQLRGRVLLPAGVTFGKSSREGSWRLTMDAPTGQNVTRFLAVYQAGAVGFTPLAESLVSDSGGQVTVQVGGNRVQINAVARTVSVDGGAPPPPPPPGNQSPVAVISGPSAGQVGQLLTFNGSESTDPDGSIVGYRWEINSIVSSGAVASITFPTWGTYQVSLTVTDNLGATGVATMPVTITALPPPPPPPPTEVEAPSLLDLPTTGNAKVILTWAQSTTVGVTRNRIYRAMSATGPWAVRATVSARVRWTDTELGLGRSYWYKVTALDANGVESAPSGVLEAVAH